MIAANPPINISDIIGFIIALIAFLYMSARPFIKKMKKSPEAQYEEADYPDVEEPVILPVVKPKAAPSKWDDSRFKFQTNIEKRTKPTAIEQRKFETQVSKRSLKEFEISFQEEISEEEAYSSKGKQEPSLAEHILKKNTLINNVMAAEILNKPRAWKGYDGRPYGL